MKFFLPLLLALGGCSESPKLQVKVTDVWDNPIAGATLFQEGVLERPTTGSDGKLTLEIEAGDHSFMAGKDGYIKELATTTVQKDAESLEALVLQLYPEPENPGFYGVGSKEYIHLEAQTIQAVSSEMSTYHGLKEAPTARLEKRLKPLRFVFNSTLRVQEIKRQDLRLSKLKYLEDAEITGVLGPETVDLHLWVADSDVEYEVRGLQSQDDYLLVVEGGLEPGFYAFHAQNVLDSRNGDVLEKLPRELKVAFTFEVK